MDAALFRYLKKITLRAVLSPLKLLKIKNNRIFLINDLGYNYSCNTKNIAEYLKGSGLEIIYSVKNKEKRTNQTGVKFVEFNSWSYFYFMMTSRVVVSNSGGYSYVPLRNKQFVINTHHGGGAYKYSGKDMFEHSYFLEKDIDLQAKQTDIFLSTNRRFTDVVSKAINMNKDKFWEIGMPRNDKLLKSNNEEIDEIRRSIGLKPNEKLVLYAPTYRKPNDNYFNESVAISYGIDIHRVCDALTKRFGGEWRFAIRFHPCVTNRDEFKYEDVLDLSDYEDMQDLLLVADVMINDFSSSMWDFMLTGKPSFLFAVDLEHYVKTTKVYTPVRDWPFPKATTNDGLVNNILCFDEEKYKVDCKKHYDDLGGCETGKATQLVCELIYKKCFGK